MENANIQGSPSVPEAAWEAPFIVWTLRRTGGTNFAQSLFECSRFDYLEHEPFNFDRAYGHISQEWEDNGDASHLRASLAEVFQEKWLIKHCVEMVPLTFNRVLAEIACDAGYRHLFLYRRDPLARLLSLEFAERAGAWSPNDIKGSELDEDAILAEPLPVEEMITHEYACRALIQDAYAHLIELEQRPLLIAFEDLFMSENREWLAQQIQGVLDFLRLNRGAAEDEQVMNDMLARPQQEIRDRYARFRGYDQLVRSLDTLGAFELRAIKASEEAATPTG